MLEAERPSQHLVSLHNPLPLWAVPPSSPNVEEEKKKESSSVSLLLGICLRQSTRSEGFPTQQPLPQDTWRGQQSPPLSLAPRQDRTQLGAAPRPRRDGRARCRECVGTCDHVAQAMRGSEGRSGPGGGGWSSPHPGRGIRWLSLGWEAPPLPKPPEDAGELQGLQCE